MRFCEGKIEKLKKLAQKIKLFLRSLFEAVWPAGKVEWTLFLFFFVFYAACGFSLLFATDLLDVQTGRAGSYLGYDNLFHAKTRGGALDIGHPFFNIFHFFKYVVTLPLAALFGAKGLLSFCILLMNLLVSAALLVIYKYLRRVVELSLFRGLLLTVFCGFFFTVIVLSFTTESYPFSFLFLTLSVYLLSKEYREQGRFSLSNVFFLQFLCGGVTVTNAIKPLSALLLNSERFKVKAVKILKAFLPFAVCVVLVALLYSVKTSSEDKETPFEQILGVTRYLVFDGQLLKQSLTNYWSSSILVAPLTYQAFFSETVLRPSVYPHAWQYALSASLLGLFLLSFFVNRKNRLVQLLAFFVLTDVVIHFIFRYGIGETIIFGGHWLFLVPIVLGWLYARLRTMPKIAVALDAYLILSIIALIINNLSEISVFFS